MPSPSPRRTLRASALASALLARPVRANAEKIIFTAPAPVDFVFPLTAITTTTAILAASNSSSSSSLRTNLTRVLPPEHAQPAWFLLSDLAHGRRYELRVCWSALEPTSFTLDVYHSDVVWSTPALNQSLSEYAAQLQRAKDTLKEPTSPSSPSSPSSHQAKHHVSAMLLRVQAVADYFSHHKNLMTRPPPPVLVDLILDPYIYNVVPRSLLPTAAYLVGVAMVAWFLAQWIVGSLISIAGSGSNDQKKKKQS